MLGRSLLSPHTWILLFPFVVSKSCWVACDDETSEMQLSRPRFAGGGREVREELVRFAGAAQEPGLAKDKPPVFPSAFGQSPHMTLQRFEPSGLPVPENHRERLGFHRHLFQQGSEPRELGRSLREKEGAPAKEPQKRRRFSVSFGENANDQRHERSTRAAAGLLSQSHQVRPTEVTLMRMTPTGTVQTAETVYLDCGTAVFTPTKWHFDFAPPNTGDFNVLVTVPENIAQANFQISTMELSVAAIFDNWQPFQVRLVAPTLTSILLKQPNTEECADLHCDFTETRSCHSCTRPVESLSAFTGESAVGTWIIAFEDSAGRKRSSAVAWASLRITFGCHEPLPTWVILQCFIFEAKKKEEPHLGKQFFSWNAIAMSAMYDVSFWVWPLWAEDQWGQTNAFGYWHPRIDAQMQFCLQSHKVLVHHPRKSVSCAHFVTSILFSEVSITWDAAESLNIAETATWYVSVEQVALLLGSTVLSHRNLPRWMLSSLAGSGRCGLREPRQAHAAISGPCGRRLAWLRAFRDFWETWQERASRPFLRKISCNVWTYSR